MKLSEVLNSQQALADLIELKLPIKTAYRLSRFINKLQPELKLYEEQRTALVREYGEKVESESGEETWQVPKDKFEDFAAEVTKLQDVEVEAKIDKVKLSELEGVSFDAKNLVVLDWLISEE